MSKNDLRTCCVCHKEYSFCPVCNPEDRFKPTWHFAYCSENCKDIYNITSSFENGRLSDIDAKAKLEKKKADAIIANDVSSSNIGFNADNHQVTILTKEGKQNPLPECSKDELALEIWKTLVAENVIR